MIKTNSISLTYSLRGECFLTRGQYDSAKLSNEPNELYKQLDGKVVKIRGVETPMVTKKQPEYSVGTQHILLGNAFVEHALERPKKPFHKASLQEWNLYSRWHKMSETAKLNEAVKKYVKDMNGEHPKWELL